MQFVCISSRQRHKNIVTILGLCLDGKLPSIITEYVIGECLKDFLKVQGRMLTWPHRVRMVSCSIILSWPHCLRMMSSFVFFSWPYCVRMVSCSLASLSQNDEFLYFFLMALLCQNGELFHYFVLASLSQNDEFLCFFLMALLCQNGELFHYFVMTSPCQNGGTFTNQWNYLSVYIEVHWYFHQSVNHLDAYINFRYIGTFTSVLIIYLFIFIQPQFFLRSVCLAQVQILIWLV